MVGNNQSPSVVVNFRVNGIDRELSVDPRYALADVLRDELALTGLHLGCEQGVCGACTVLIDGEPAVSCLTLAVQAQGCDIQTVEHFSQSTSELGQLEKSFLKHGAFQCGFCTPGFLVMAHHILDNGLGNDREKVRECLSGNICRCTGYEPIIDAIVAASSGEDFK
jgi:aerobic carbon-monoxide dehydrogenase small subunit